jgi:hypothetical protein
VQGCYGYKNDKLVQDVCQLYREKNLPCDGIHIDVDFASKYQSFTHDEARPLSLLWLPIVAYAILLSDAHGRLKT